MHTAASDKHNPEFGDDVRFEFGKNWQRFLRDVNEERIIRAESSLKQMLGCESLAGKRFLDVGSGSGLFSLAARRLGAEVVSFDYDLKSVACTHTLRQKFFPDDKSWRIEQGSALDQDYLRSLGSFDVVYSWGVLHHTGAMWTALDNVRPLVREHGKLFLAIYNDQGRISRLWRTIKRAYTHTHPRLRFLILWPVALFLMTGMIVKDTVRLRRPRFLSKSDDPRGMSDWSNMVDWVGGYPFEVASREQISAFYTGRGFRLDRLVSAGRKMGCNQYLFTNFGEGPSSPT